MKKIKKAKRGKKLLVTLGAITTIAGPVIGVAACGGDSENEKPKIPGHTYSVKTSLNDIAGNFSSLTNKFIKNQLSDVMKGLNDKNSIGISNLDITLDLGNKKSDKTTIDFNKFSLYANGYNTNKDAKFYANDVKNYLAKNGLEIKDGKLFKMGSATVEAKKLGYVIRMLVASQTKLELFPSSKFQDNKLFYIDNGKRNKSWNYPLPKTSEKDLSPYRGYFFKSSIEDISNAPADEHNHKNNNFNKQVVDKLKPKLDKQTPEGIDGFTIILDLDGKTSTQVSIDFSNLTLYEFGNRTGPIIKSLSNFGLEIKNGRLFKIKDSQYYNKMSVIMALAIIIGSSSDLELFPATIEMPTNIFYLYKKNGPYLNYPKPGVTKEQLAPYRKMPPIKPLPPK